MKRKLISFDVFENIQNNSLSAAEIELVEAAPILAKSLDVTNLELLSYGPESALFESTDGTYINANYKIENNAVKFDNIEQLEIDNETEKTKSREKISALVEAILEGNDEKGNALFNDYLNMPSIKRTLKESVSVAVSTGKGKKSKFRGKHRAGGKAAALKAARTRKKNDRLTSPAMKEKIKELRKAAEKKLGGKTFQTKKGQRSVRTYIRRGAKQMMEWNNLCENVFGFVDYKEFGPALNESIANFDDNGNVTNVTVPNIKARNEAKILSFNWKTLGTDVKVLRSSAKTLSEDTNFCKAVADLKRHNNMADNSALEESLENIVSKWPSVLYLTQDELANTIKVSLETVNARMSLYSA